MKTLFKKATSAKFIPLVILAVAFAGVFGPAAFAAFVKIGASPADMAKFSYGYGYGDSGYGYGYGYGDTYTAPGTDIPGYGFSGISGVATPLTASATQTSFNVAFSTSYNAKAHFSYGLSTSLGTSFNPTAQPISQSAFVDDGSTYNSYTRTANVTGLTCGTTYYYGITTQDIGGNSWSTTPAAISTSACDSGTVIVGAGGGGGAGGGIYNYPPTTGGSTTTNGTGATGAAPQFFLNDLTTLGQVTADAYRLQVFLNHHGFPVTLSGAGSLGNEIPTFGPATQAAVKRFQIAHNITPVTGWLGPKTRAAINSILLGEAQGTTTPGVTAPFYNDLVGYVPNSPDAQRLQVFLNAHNFQVAPAGAAGSPGNEIPSFGPATQAALKRFQIANRITPVTGWLGPKTRALINSLIQL